MLIELFLRCFRRVMRRQCQLTQDETCPGAPVLGGFFQIMTVFLFIRPKAVRSVEMPGQMVRCVGIIHPGRLLQHLLGLLYVPQPQVQHGKLVHGKHIAHGYRLLPPGPGGLLSGQDRKSAAKFSFMMSAPAIAGALLLEGKDAIENGWISDLAVVPTIVGVIVSAVVGYLAIRFMLKLITKVSLNWFALYVAILGVIFLAAQLFSLPGVVPFAPPAEAAAALTFLL